MDQLYRQRCGQYPNPHCERGLHFCSTRDDTGAALIKIHDRNEKYEVEEKYFLQGNELQNTMEAWCLSPTTFIVDTATIRASNLLEHDKR